MAALYAVRAIIPCGATELIRDLAAFRESNLLIWNEVFDPKAHHNFMARLCDDGNPKVRKRFFLLIEVDVCFYLLVSFAGGFATFLFSPNLF